MPHTLANRLVNSFYLSIKEHYAYIWPNYYLASFYNKINLTIFSHKLVNLNPDNIKSALWQIFKNTSLHCNTEYNNISTHDQMIDYYNVYRRRSVLSAELHPVSYVNEVNGGAPVTAGC